MKKLGLDWGQKRIGIAITDEILAFAHPLDIIKNSFKIKDFLKDIIKEEDIDEVVVGLPLTLRGEIGEQAVKVKKQVDKIFKDIKVKLTFWDERMSTIHADRLLKEKEFIYKKRKKVKKVNDKIAACLILQSYLDYLKKKNEKIL